MILHLGLFESKLRELFNLQDLSQSDQQAVLLDFAITQENFTVTIEGVLLP